jgi:CheY-like chemotaxis protein
VRTQTGLSILQTHPEVLSVSLAPEQQVKPPRTNILIVDDDQVTLKALSLKLEADGYEVNTATDVSEAMACVRSQRPELIILDIDLAPDLSGGIFWDGFRVLDLLRRLDETCNTPVIFITVADLATCHEKALRAGVAGLFQKPIRHQELVCAIEEALALARVRSQIDTSRRSKAGQAS